jgi:hypothetical protein
MALWILVEPASGVIDAAIPSRDRPERPGLQTWEVADVDLWNRLAGEVRSRSRDGRAILRPHRLTPPDPERPVVASDIARVPLSSLDSRVPVVIEASLDDGATWIPTPPDSVEIARDTPISIRLGLCRPDGTVRTDVTTRRLVRLGANDRPMPYIELRFTNGYSQPFAFDTSEPRDLVIDGSEDVLLYSDPIRVRIYETSRIG